MRKIPFSRAFVIAALCAFSPVCLAQGMTLGGDGGGGAQATIDQFGRPLSGTLPPEQAPFDDLISPLLQKYDIPGCVVAAMYDDQIVMVRGYGWADRDKKIPVSPDSLFRVGALSKPITSAAILMLVQDKKLSLDTPVFEILNDLAPFPGATRDPRLDKITVRDLLRHSGGWDVSTSFDPFDRLKQIATAAKQPAPPDRDSVIRYMMGQPLQFDPGTKFAYSNFGYVLLGRVIEKISGIGYEDFVTSKLMRPLSAETFRLGTTRLQERDPDEVHYYDYKGAPMTTSLFDNSLAARPDGSIGLEVRGASDGWVGSASDYLRFVGAVDANPTLDDALTPDTIAQMVSRPPYALKDDYYYGLGWYVRPRAPYNPKEPNNHYFETTGSWWHDGAMPGTSSFVGRDAKKRVWVALFNSHPKDDKAWTDDVQDALYGAIAKSTFPDPDAPNPNNNNGNPINQ